MDAGVLMFLLTLQTEPVPAWPEPLASFQPARPGVAASPGPLITHRPPWGSCPSTGLISATVSSEFQDVT